ncbi:MAG: helix-turn-helix domain-containing protein [Eubacteriales bacterium]|nr:helix-turn-helix domain-containing protein [Eubacteriales bacterium]
MHLLFDLPKVDEEEADPKTQMEYYRELRGMTKETLAEKMGISFEEVCNYEKGFNPIYFETAQKLGEVLSADPMLFTDEHTWFCRLGYGKRIARIRNEYKLNQEEFSELIGMSRTAVSMWEAEIRHVRPSYENYLKLKELAAAKNIDIKLLADDIDAYPDKYEQFVAKDCAKKIRYIRSHYKMLQREFAELLGCVTNGAVTGWELGKTVPLRGAYERIEDAATKIGIDLEKLNQDPEYYESDYLRFIKSDVNKKIFFLRLQVNMTQDEFASAIGYRGNTISEWELGNIVPNEESFSKIEDFARENGIDFNLWNEHPALYRDPYTEFRNSESSQKIKAVRKAYGMSQVAFAKLVGVSTTSIKIWEDENRDRYPDRKYFDILFDLAKKKGVIIDESQRTENMVDSGITERR